MRHYISLPVCVIVYVIACAVAPTLGGTQGKVQEWGDQIVGVDLSSDFAAIATSGQHSLGLKTDGSIIAWGDNTYGQCNVPAPNSGFVAISACAQNSLGLKADGSIVAWGDNTYGQRNVPAPNSDFAAVAAGAYHSLGLKTDGSIVAWGSNTYGQCNVPTPNSGFAAIAAVGDHSVVIRGYVGDANGDGHVDVIDLLWFVDSFGKSKSDSGFNPDADFNNDNMVDMADLLILVDNFGK